VALPASVRGACMVDYHCPEPTFSCPSEWGSLISCVLFTHLLCCRDCPNHRELSCTSLHSLPCGAARFCWSCP
jgi:hypothetical protein